MEIDIFNRENLIGDQDTSSINNFNDYLDSLLNSFNNLITIELLDLDDLNDSISKPIAFINPIVNDLQIKDNNIQNKSKLINDASLIINQSNEYVTELTATKAVFTNILNAKALPSTSLVRPKLSTVSSNNNSAVNIGYVSNKIIPYTLPIPIPNTKLYVNRSGNGFIWL